MTARSHYNKSGRDSRERPALKRGIMAKTYKYYRGTIYFKSIEDREIFKSLSKKIYKRVQKSGKKMGELMIEALELLNLTYDDKGNKR